MIEPVTYRWNEELGRAAAQAVQKNRIGRSSYLLAAGVLFVVAGVLLWIRRADAQGILVFIMVGIFCALVVVNRFRTRRLVADLSRLSPDHQVTIAVTEADLTVSSELSTTTLPWDRLTTAKEVDGFLLIFAGKLLCACLPVEPLNGDMLELINKKIGPSNKVIQGDVR